MATEVRATVRGRPRGSSEIRERRRPPWHYAVAATGVLVLAGLGWGGYAVWFSMTHLRATYARVSGYVVNVSAKSDTRVQRLLVKTGDQVRAGQEVVALDNADLAAEVSKAQAQLAAQQSARARAEADLEMTIRQGAANEQQAAAELAAAQARLAQAKAELQLQGEQQPEEVRTASARLKSARANLKRVESGARPQEIEQARAEVTAAQAKLDNAASYLARMQKLHGQGAVSAQQLEEAVTNKQVVEASLRSAQEKLSLLRAGNRQEDIERARQDVAAAEATLSTAKAQSLQSQMKSQQVATRVAEARQADASLFAAQSTRRMVALKEQDVLAQRSAVAQAEAALKQARVRLQETSLRSPVSGIVIRSAGSAVHEGEVVAKGLPIVTIVSTENPASPDGNPFWISAAVSELYATRVHEGQPVMVRVEALGSRKFRGTVEQVGGATELQSSDSANQWTLQQVPIRVKFDRAGAAIKPGLSCQVWIDLRK